jgi:hypothetical protein
LAIQAGKANLLLNPVSTIVLSARERARAKRLPSEWGEAKGSGKQTAMNTGDRQSQKLF